MKKNVNLPWLRAALIALTMLPMVACADSNQTDTVASAANVSKKADATSDQTPPAFAEDVHYMELFDPVPTSTSTGKIEVVELFWYGCPHCYQMEPALEKWKSSLADDVQLVQIPAVFKDRSGKPNPAWELSARAYYALEALGKSKALHPRIFTAIHEQGRRLNSVDAFARFVGSQGVDEEKFRQAMTSLAVDTKTRKAIELTERYGITGVPSLIVDGRYRVLNKAVTSYDEMFQIVDFLVEKERSRAKKGS